MCEATNNNILTQATTQAFTKLINKVHMAFRQFMQQKFKEHNIDITFEMVQVMGHLWHQDGVNQQEIANAILKDKTSLTYLIDNLTRRNLVERREDNLDRRNKLIFLTPEGRLLRETILVWINEMYALAGQDISEKTLLENMCILEKMYCNLKTIT